MRLLFLYFLSGGLAVAQISVTQPAGGGGGGSTTWGGVTGVLSNQSDLQSALDAKTTLPSQSGQSGKFLTTNGTSVSWATVSGGGGGTWGSIIGDLSSQTDLQSALDAKQPSIGVGGNGEFLKSFGGSLSWAGLSSSDIGNWPSAVRTTTVSIVTLTNAAILPADTIQAALGKAQAQINAIPLVPSQSGQGGKFLTTNGSSLSWGTPTGSGGGGSVAWGSITGALSDQTDLNSALSGKEPAITSGTAGQFWRGDKSWQALAPSDMSGFNAGVIGALPAQSGQSGKYLTTNGSTLSWGTPVGGGGGGTPATITVYTSSGTWTKPSGAIMHRVVAVGGGGGGGGGGQAATSTAVTGGGGGGGAARVEIWFADADLGSTETITIGSGGAGSVGSGSGNASNGNNGGDTSFGSKLIAYGGGGGGGGRSGSTSAGGGGGSTRGTGGQGTGGVAGASGGAGAGAGGAGGTGAASTAPFCGAGGGGGTSTGGGSPSGAAVDGCSGGSSGGGVNASNAAQGTLGAYSFDGVSSNVGSGVNGTAGAASPHYRGAGGSGAGGSLTTGAIGGDGGFPGGGAGGGGGGRTAGGAGGNGGNGVVVVYSYF